MATRTTLASDDFNRADGGLGSNWTTIVSTTAPAIVSNTIHDQGAAASSGAFYSGVPNWPSDSWAQITLVTQEASAGSQGVGLRIQPAAYSGYLGFFDAGTGNLRIRRVDAGAATNLVAVAYTFAANDVLRFEAIASQLRLYINDVLKLATFDTTYKTGSAGYIGFRQAADNSCDDWSAGSFDLDGRQGYAVGRPFVGTPRAGTYRAGAVYPYMFAPQGVLRSPQQQWRTDAQFPVEVWSDAVSIAKRRRQFAGLLHH